MFWRYLFVVGAFRSPLFGVVVVLWLLLCAVVETFHLPLSAGGCPFFADVCVIIALDVEVRVVFSLVLIRCFLPGAGVVSFFRGDIEKEQHVLV